MGFDTAESELPRVGKFHWHAPKFARFSFRYRLISDIDPLPVRHTARTVLLPTRLRVGFGRQAGGLGWKRPGAVGLSALCVGALTGRAGRAGGA